MSFRLGMKLSLPIAFFGYAAFANYNLLTSDLEGPKLAGLMTGDVTQEIDTIYRAHLPHRDPAVGIIGAMRYATLGEGRRGVVVGRDGWLFTDEEFRPLDRAAHGLDETVAYIAAVRATLASAGADLVMLPLPGKLDLERSNAPAGDQAERIADEYAEFVTALKSAGIDTVDTRPILAKEDGPFFRTDTHWTPNAAFDVAQAVARSGTVPKGDMTFDVVRQTPVRFTGDLVSFVTTDTLAPIVGLSPEHVVPYLAEGASGNDSGDGLDIFGEQGGGAYALVGTSYSANPYWSFAEALKLALSQDVLNYAEEGQGPVAPMAAFLDRVNAESVPPVVIWEFPVRYLSDPKLLDPVEDQGHA